MSSRDSTNRQNLPPPLCGGSAAARILMGSARRLSAGDVVECPVGRTRARGPGGRADRPRKAGPNAFYLVVRTHTYQAKPASDRYTLVNQGSREVAPWRPD